MQNEKESLLSINLTDSVGKSVVDGDAVGARVGDSDGARVGADDGALLGAVLGALDGARVGARVGDTEGCAPLHCLQTTKMRRRSSERHALGIIAVLEFKLLEMFYQRKDYCKRFHS